jgi:8-oxo-dGTP diphosphatase
MTRKDATPQHPMPFTRLELCIFSLVHGRLSVLLARRAGEPFKGKWALPGGVLRIDLDATLEAAAQRVANERLGLGLPYLRQQCAVGAAGRDPRSPWAMSIVYRAFISPAEFHPEGGKRIEELVWRGTDDASGDHTLAFDHASLIAAAAASLRAEVERLEIPREVLPAQFTLAELQAFNEQVLGRPLDKSSFRRKLDARALVEPVVGAIRHGANRPAQLFKMTPQGGITSAAPLNRVAGLVRQ